MTSIKIILFFACAITLAACGGGGDRGTLCENGKCDTPGSTADRVCAESCCMAAGLTGTELDTCLASAPNRFSDSENQACFDECREGEAVAHCEARRADALESSQVAFVPDAIRWACADVDGVNTNNQDDRGQEYCEYYAVIQPPPTEEGGELPPPVDLGRKLNNSSSTPLSLELTDDQLFALEDELDAVVGQCIFTSWHQDVPGPLPVCDGGTCPNLSLPANAVVPSWMADNPEIAVPLSANFMQMKVTINSNFAAVDLVEKCMAPVSQGDPEVANDPLHDPYMRGCMGAFSLFGTEWRRSDPTICTAAMRLSECGCGVDTDADGVADLTIDPEDQASRFEVARALIPEQPNADGDVTLRGFKLGTWSDPSGLPAGCHYVDIGEDTQAVVACDLTAGDVIASQSDPKERCREKYGDDVVVHIPVPTAAIVCTPPEENAYSDTCGTYPWVLDDGVAFHQGSNR